jgi:hypothetical protein
MRKNFFWFLFLGIMVLAACAAQKKTNGSAGSSSGTRNLVKVKMLRTPCFGKCPNYEVEISSDGTVRYRGIRFTEKTGIYEKNIGATKANQLIAKFTTARVDTFKNEYTLNVSDLPGIIYTFTYNGDTKEIRNAHFGPPILKQLAKEVDAAILPDKDWKQVSDTPGEQ